MDSRLAALTGLAASSIVLARGRGQAVDNAGGWVFSGTPFTATAPDGARIEGECAGRGPAVVLSHCWTGDRSIWEPVAARLLAGGHRVITYDQRGHGESTIGSDSPSLEVLAADLRLVLDECDVEDAVIAGHSLGGMTAMQAVLPFRPPGQTPRANTTTRDIRIAGIALISTSAVPLAPAARRLGIGFILSSLTGSRFANAAINSRAGALLARPALGRAPSATARMRTLHTLRMTPRQVRGAQLREIGNFNALKGLATVPVPTQIVVGTRDRLTPSSHAKKLHATLHNSTLTRLSKAGHMLPLERPDATAEAITTLRASVAAPQSPSRPTPTPIAFAATA